MAQPLTLEQMENGLDTTKADSIKVDYLNAIGTHYLRTGDSPTALTYFLKARDLSETIGDSNRIVSCMLNHGSVFFYSKDYANAKKFYRDAQDVARRHCDLFKNAAVNINVGAVYDANKQYDSARYYYQIAKLDFMGLKDTKHIAVCEANIASLYSVEEDYDRALEAYDASNQLYQSIGRRYELMINYFNMAVMFSKMKAHDKAIEYYRKSLMYEEEGFLPNDPADVYKGISKAYEALNDYEQALDNYKTYHEMSDSIQEIGNDLKVEEIHSKYQNDIEEKELERLLKEQEANEEIVALKDKTMALQKSKLKKNKLLSVILLILVIVLVGGIATIALLFRKIKKVNTSLLHANHELEVRAKKTELKALLAQITPHFVFNSLNSIQNFIIQNDIDSSIKYLGKFSKLMRTTLTHSDKDMVVMQLELESLEDYVGLEKLRLNKPLEFSIHVDDGVNTHNLLIPPLLIQPLLENAIWHGVSELSGPGKIELHIREVGDVLVVELMDNGVGIKEQEVNEEDAYHHVRGLDITRNRIEQLWFQKGEYKSLKLSSNHTFAQGNGLKIEFELPVKF